MDEVLSLLVLGRCKDTRQEELKKEKKEMKELKEEQSRVDKDLKNAKGKIMIDPSFHLVCVSV